MKNKVLLFTSMFLMWGLAINDAHAERKLMAYPEPVVYKAERYFDKDYKDKLDRLNEKAEKLRDEKLTSQIQGLYQTTRRKKAREVIKELTPLVNKYKKKDPDIANLLDEIGQKIETNHFNKGRAGVDLEVDRKNREYILTWDENGKEVSKKTPFVPEMKLILQAAYEVKAGKDNGTYKYWMENKKGSQAPVRELYLENKIPKDKLTEIVMAKFGRPVSYKKISEDKIMTVYYPTLRATHVSMHTYSPTNRKLHTYQPGQKMGSPYELEAFEGTLPGVIEGFVPVPIDYFNPHAVISPEYNPEIAVDALLNKDETFTMYMHRALTIGPVPIPDPFDRDAFIDRIISYNEQSIEEGWNDHPPVIKFTREGLARIKGDPANKKQIEVFIAELEGYYEKDKILSEAYALLKYNLEYILEKL